MGKLSEQLRREIWSKRTTRIIWIVLLFLLLAGYGCQLLYKYWVTPRERKAAAAALQSVRALRDAETADEPIYAARLQEAKSRVARCNAVRITERDWFAEIRLEGYIHGIEFSRALWESPYEDISGKLSVDKSLKLAKLEKLKVLEDRSYDSFEKELGIKKN